MSVATQFGGAQLALAGVGKRFQARDRVVNALEATTLTIENGEFVTLVGPSGCGKSTLLNIISGLSFASEGSVRLDGTTITGVNRRVGYITQQDNLFPWRTLWENVALPLELAGVSPGNGVKKLTAGSRGLDSVASAMLSLTNCQVACANAATSCAR